MQSGWARFEARPCRSIIMLNDPAMIELLLSDKLVSHTLAALECTCSTPSLSGKRISEARRLGCHGSVH